MEPEQSSWENSVTVQRGRGKSDLNNESHPLLSKANFAALLTPTYTGPEIRRYFGGAWSMHLAFAWDLIRELQPRSFVELGVYKGESYFTFCQSVEENALSTLCYGIDTWWGDVHMGTYGRELGREVQAYNARYSGFSNLLTMTFDEALAHFTDGSIDLLHIDGSHRYEDVKRDFDRWLPKVSEQGIILLHDVMVRDRGFGVWRLWLEIARHQPGFVFEFGHGLGIWKKHAVSEDDSALIKKLLLGDETERREITNHYAIAAAAIDLKNKAGKPMPEIASGRVQVFAPRYATYSESHSNGCDLPTGSWRRVRVDLTWQLGDGSRGLRIDPGDGPSIVEIAGILIRSKLTREVLWGATTPLELSQSVIGGTAVRIPHKRVFRILSWGSDPQLILPLLTGSQFESPLLLEAWMRLEQSVQAIAKSIGDLQSHYEASDQELRKHLESSAVALRLSAVEKGTLEQQREFLETALRKARQQDEEKQAKVVALRSEVEQVERAAREKEASKEAEIAVLRSEAEREAREKERSRQAEIAALRSEAERLEREGWENKVRRADLTARLKDRDRWIEEVRRSAGWKIAKPLWKLQRHFSRRPCPPSKPRDLVFALDGFGTSGASHDVLRIKGWCFARAGPPIVGVRAKVGRKSYFAQYGLQREDVARTALDQPGALRGGFSIKVPLAKGVSLVRLEAIVLGGSWECFVEHSLVGKTPNDEEVSTRRSDEGDNPPPTINLANGRYEQPSPRLYASVPPHQLLSSLRPLIRQHINRTRSEIPLFSVITPTFNTLPHWLAEAGASLLNQTLHDWEWCLVDDGSKNPEVRQMLESLASEHSAFRVRFAENAGISAATNQALDFAKAEFVCFLDHDDLLHPEALSAMAEKFRESFDAVYSDEDKLDDTKGVLVEPFFKPEWSPEYFRGAMYVGHLLCVRRDLAARVRFDGTFDGVQDFDFLLRLSETGARIGHVPRVLYHWRKVAGSLAQTSDAKPQAATLQRKAVNGHLQRLGLAARAESGATPHRLKIVPVPRSSFPKISVIIPTKDSPELLSRCLNSLYENTTYPNFEAVLVDNDTTDRDALAAMRAHPVVRLYLSNPFNFSRANNLATQHASGEYFVFLNNDTEVVTASWLDHLLYYAEQPDVGAAGALLLHDNGAVQHGGVVLGMRGTADHVMRGFPARSDGYAGSLTCAREVSAVTAACMMIRRLVFENLQGFNQHFFTIYQDLDLCLRIRERGLRIIWTPEVVLLHHESVSRQKYYDLVDRYLLLDQWQSIIERGDPYYNPNLNLERGDYSLRNQAC